MTKNQKFETTLENFSFKVASKLYAEGKNLIYSPSSLHFAMGMLLEGTDGNSCNEIVSTMFDQNFNGDSNDVESASNFLSYLASGHPDGIQKLINVANFCYLQKEFKLHPNFIDSIQKKYNASSRELDFVKENLTALNAINNDVNTATKGLIPKFLDSIAQDTQAILVNAIYFKGLWKKPFEKYNTKENGKFHLSNGEVVEVPLMSVTSNFSVGHDEKNKAKILRLPYDSKKEFIYLAIILPEEGKLKQYLDNFDAENFNQILNSCTPIDRLHVILPRFKIESSHCLVPVLKGVGISDVFTNNANLSKMTGLKSELQVSEIFQKAIIELNEEGTEAAAATGIMMRLCCALEFQPEFHANRPFVYAVIAENDDAVKHILFVGVVENPQA